MSIDWNKYEEWAFSKRIDREPYDMDDAADRITLQALARRVVLALVANDSQEEVEYKLKLAGHRRTLGRALITSDIQKGEIQTNDEEAFINLYAETFYHEYTFALAEKAGISVDPYAITMPWGAWEFDFTKGVDILAKLEIDRLAGERVAAITGSMSQESAQYLLGHADALSEMLDSECSANQLRRNVWASDYTVLDFYFNTAFKAYYLAALVKLAGVVISEEARLASLDAHKALMRRDEEQKEKEQQAQAQQEQKRRELFPDPQPLRVEKAGIVIKFTTWDAALVVSMDCTHKGKTVEITCDDVRTQIALRKGGHHKAEVIERTAGNTTVCAAIFPRIPLVTDHHKKALKAVEYVNCKVMFSFHDLEDTKLDEEVILIKGQVTELDWQAETKPKTSEPPVTSTAGQFVGAYGELYEYKIIDAGKTKGENTADAHYPSAFLPNPAVIRDPQEIQALAEHSFEIWFRSLNATEQEKKNWELSATEGKRLYVTAFIAAYTNVVAKRDKEAGVTPTLPATTSTTGATITVAQEKHTADLHTYWLKLADPRYLDEMYEVPEPLTVDFSDTTTSDIGTVASSGTAAMASAGSDIVYHIPAPPNTSQTFEKRRKPRIYWGKR